MGKIFRLEAKKAINLLSVVIPPFLDHREIVEEVDRMENGEDSHPTHCWWMSLPLVVSGWR